MLNEYEFSWGERHSVVSAESWLRGYTYLRDIIANENKNVLMFVKNGHVHTYNQKRDIKIAVEIGKATIRPDFLGSHLARSSEVRDQFLALYKELKNVNFKNKTNSDLSNLFKRYQDIFDKIWAYFKVSQPEYLDLPRTQLLDLLKKSAGSNDVDEIFVKLTTPVELDLIKEEEIATLQQDSLSTNDIWSYAERFPWLFFNTYDRKIIEKFLRQKFDDLSTLKEDQRNGRVLEIKQKMRKHRLERAHLLKKLNNSKIDYLSDLFCSLAIDRLKLKAWWGGAEYLFIHLFEEIAVRAKIDVEDLLMSYRFDDIIKFLEKNVLISQINFHRQKDFLANQIQFNENVKYRQRRC